MSDYRLEYTCLVYMLFLYDEDEGWERILIDNDFMYHDAIKVLTERLEEQVNMLKKSKNKEGLEFYTSALKAVRRIYD